MKCQDGAVTYLSLSIQPSQVKNALEFYKCLFQLCSNYQRTGFRLMIHMSENKSSLPTANTQQQTFIYVL